jgi:transposase, IS5 family
MQLKTEKQLKLNFFPTNLINPHSKWYRLESIMPWHEIEELLSSLFSPIGRNAIPVRQIIGALIIQIDKNLSDRETIETIMETPMLQYFLGLDDFQHQPIFDFSLLCKYRQRIGIDIAKEMIDTLLKNQKVIVPPQTEKITHMGSISTDATVIPVNITYPTDLKLLNKVREETEDIIDDFHQHATVKQEKPRTYRKNARADYLKYAKSKKRSTSHRREGIRKQLQYVRRNLETIETRVNEGIYVLNEVQIDKLALCKHIYEQQHTMWETKTNTIQDRIVSLHQPHIRCIVRGKAGKPYEFGPKITLSKVNGFFFIDEIQFNAFNEQQTLLPIIETYKQKYGVYPEVVRADKIYQTQANKVVCSKLKIRLSGKPLGRPKKDASEENHKIMKLDAKKRQEIEGAIGIAKTRYGLSNLMTKLPESQIASIGLVFLVMNLNQTLSFVQFSDPLEMLVFELDINNEVHIHESERPSFLKRD